MINKAISTHKLNLIIIRLSAVLMSIAIMISFIGCSSNDNGYNADKVRTTALDRLQQGKTYLLLDGINDAITHYLDANDTIHLLEMYQLASIKMRWKGEQDSAAMFLLKAVDFTTAKTTPSTCEVYLDLAEIYSHPLLRKDYKKAIEYGHRALKVDMSGENKSRILHDIGIYYAFLNENDSAIAYFDKAINQTPTNSQYYTTYALNYSNLPIVDFKKSIECLDKIEGKSLGKLITKGFLYLNHGQTDSAYTYLERSKTLYDLAPENYSINTYNSLRMLSNCVSYAMTGKVYPGEGTEINDSISQRIILNKKVDAETAEHNAMLEIELLASKSKAQMIWIVALILILLASVVFALIFWNNKRKYIRLHKEFDRLRHAQILIEANENNIEEAESFEIIKKRAEICINRFRKAGQFDLIQKGEITYNNDGSYLSIKERTIIRQSLLECFADFIVDLKMDAGKIAMDDIITTLLCVLKAGNAAIAACLGVSVGAVRTRKTRLRAKLSSEMAKFVFG